MRAEPTPTPLYIRERQKDPLRSSRPRGSAHEVDAVALGIVHQVATAIAFVGGPALTARTNA
jgi:hypothetical protein